MISVGEADVKERRRQQAEALMLFLEYQLARERLLINAPAQARLSAAPLMIQAAEVLRSSQVSLLRTAVIRSLRRLKSPTTPTGYVSPFNTDKKVDFVFFKSTKVCLFSQFSWLL